MSRTERPAARVLLLDAQDRVLLFRFDAGDRPAFWATPGGAIDPGESYADAAKRELREETGLDPEHVEVVGATPGWLRYRLPSRCVRRGSRPTCIGQKQVWFLLKMRCDETTLRLDLTDKPEFDAFRWVDFWYPCDNVVQFKREVYVRALRHLAPFAVKICGDSDISANMPALPARETRPRRAGGQG